MAVTSTRPWEDRTPAAPKEQLPSIATLTNNLPPGNSLSSPTSMRDSGTWSSTRDADSIRSSTYSTGTSAYLSSNTNSYYMSPQRVSTVSSTSGYGTGPHASADYSLDRSSQGPLSSPAANGHGSLLPSLNQVHEPSVKEEVREFPPRESRRNSIGSQMNQGMGQLHLNGFNSPYSASANHSQTSLTQSLNAQRGIPNHTLRNSRSTAQLQRSPPTSNMTDARPTTGVGRQAPPIVPIPGREIVSGHEPVKGQAYAFPDVEDIEPGALPPNRTLHSRSSGHSAEHVHLGSLTRRGSGHTSLASSVLTTDSHLPPGQHRLDESISNAHHHSLRTSVMEDVLEDESMTPEDGHTPYSRTPALRVSHKMAERKRRSEMKDLFENLRSQIPSNQGSKSSKWEILSKACDYIKQLEGQTGMTDRQFRAAMQDLEMTRRAEHSLRDENSRLMQELQMLRQQQGSGQPQPPAHQQQAPLPQAQAPQPIAPQGPPPSAYTPQNYVPPPPPPPPQPMIHDPARSLPPLGGAPPQASGGGMEGIRYSH